jgi:N-acetylmuramoyl-L-alanine amidase
MQKVIFLDAGHGGIDPSTFKYTTKNAKQFKHNKGQFHDGNMFFEGVKNREYCSLLHERLVECGITVIPVYHPYLDTPLSNRVNMANVYHKNICEGIYVSEHSNAANTKARGFSVWTSIGQTKSDVYADILLEEYKNTFGEIKSIRIREQDYKDGDGDYESNFYVLRNTDMPAILTENLFFDQYDDAMMLMSDWYKETYVECLVRWIKKIV